MNRLFKKLDEARRVRISAAVKPKVIRASNPVTPLFCRNNMNKRSITEGTYPGNLYFNCFDAYEVRQPIKKPVKQRNRYPKPNVMSKDKAVTNMIVKMPMT